MIALYQSDTFKNTSIAGFSSIVKLLNTMETAWTAEQKTLQQQEILNKTEKGRLQSLYTHMPASL